MEEVSIKSLILGEATETKAPGKARSKSAPPVFEVVANSGIDFAIRRTRGRSSKLLAMIASQGQFYVKDERSGEVAALDSARLEGFLSGMPAGGAIHIGNVWIEALVNTKSNRSALLSFVEDADPKVLATGYLRYEDAVNRHGQYSTYSVAARNALGRNHLRLIAHVMSKKGDVAHEHLKNAEKSMWAFAEVEKVYGLDRARRFVDAYLDGRENAMISNDSITAVLSIPLSRETLVSRLSRSPGLPKLYQHVVDLYHERIAFPDAVVRFDFERFKSYVLDDSRRSGYARQMDEWCRKWADTLAMQLIISGNVTDKYPAHLASEHDRLAYEVNMAKMEIEEEAWNHREESGRWLDFAEPGAGLIVQHARTPEEIRQEAANQHNCLASYIPKVLAGRSLIAFCRPEDDPQRSYLTIEVDPVDRKLVQVKAKYNDEPDAEGMAFLQGWCASRGIDPGRYRAEMPASV